MPIVFAQPEPFAPGINSVYGQALQWSQDAPTLAHLAGQTADASQRQQGMQQAGELARSQLGAETANRQADRYTASQISNANREQSGLELSAQLTARHDDQMLHANAMLQQQAEAAQLQDWVNKQQMTAKQNMMMQQQQNQLDQVLTDPNLGPPGVWTPERIEMASQIRGVLGPLQIKKMQADLEREKAQTKLMSEQANHELTKTQMQVNYANKNFDDIVKERADPDARREYAAEAERLGIPPEAREGYIQKRAGETGRTSTWVFKPDTGGNFSWEHVKKDTAAKAEKPEKAFDVTKAQKDAHAEALLAVPRNTVVEGKVVDTADEIQRRNEYATKVFERLRDAHGKQGGAQQSDPGPQTTGSVVRDIFAKKNEIEQRQDLSVEVKQRFINGLGWAIQAIEQAGGANKLKPEQKAAIIDLGMKYDQLPPPSVPAAGGEQSAESASGAAAFKEAFSGLRSPQGGDMRPIGPRGK